MNWRSAPRKWHRWGAVLVAAPFLVVLVSGLLLQVKKQFPWVQPPTLRGSGGGPGASWNALLEAAQAVPEAGIQSWGDVERIDVRPDRGVVKLIARSRWELQIDWATADVLQVAYRRSDLIESLHDGSWFGESAKLGVFLPSAAIVLGLWATGIYLFVLPHYIRWRRKR